MTTARNRAADYLILDMSTIRFQWNPDHTACAALTSRGEILGVVSVDAPPSTEGEERELAFRLLDNALDGGQVLRPDPNNPSDPGARLACKVALYNPCSAEVSVAAVPHTVTFTDRELLEIPQDGLLARAVSTGRNPTMTTVEGRELFPRDLTFAGLTRVHLAHQAA